MRRHRFSESERRYIQEAYINTPVKDIAATIGVSIHSIRNIVFAMGLRRPREFLSQIFAKAMADPNHPGRKSQFRKGAPAFNKGLKWSQYMSEDAMRAAKTTCFKKGSTPVSKKPVGYERINNDGYIEIKVSEPDVFKLKHRVVWEQHNDPIKQGCNIQFRDGNRLNCDVENLYIISREEQMRANSGPLNLSDGMVAFYLAGGSQKLNKAFFEAIKRYPHIIELKRNQLLLNREITKKHGDRKSNTDSTGNDRQHLRVRR